MTIEEVRQLFTKSGTNSEEELDLLRLGCLTSKSNNFSLDDQGNLTVNSLTTRTGNINDSSSYDIDKVYPVGSIFISVNSTNPSTLFGGTWEQIQNRFLLACGSSYSNGSTGGSTNHSHTFSLAGTNSYTLNSWGCHIVGPSSVDGVSNATFNTSTNSNMPPYLAVYMWKRIV